MSIARERIEILYREAEKKCRNGRKELCRRYIELAKRLSEKTQTLIPRDLKNRTCDGCGVFLLPGKNCETAVSDGKAVYTCECGRRNILKPGEKSSNKKS